MNGNQSRVWRKVTLSLVVAFGLGFLAHLTLVTLPAKASNEAANPDQNISSALLASANVFTVTGVVRRNQAETPVEGVEVFAFSGAAQAKTFTNSSGRYTLTLDAGAYDFVFHPPLTSGLASQSRRGIRESQGLDVTLPPGHLISGTVYSDVTKTTPVSNVNIFASNPKTFVGLGARPTLADGTYALSLETGNWELTFTPPHFLGLGPTRAAVISLTHDITQDAILPPGFTITGLVTADGKGVPNVDIFAQANFNPGGSGFGITATDANGVYTGTLPAGNFDILYFAPPFSGYGSTVVTNVTGPPDLQGNVSLPSGYTVSGKVTTCAALANVFVHAAPQSPVSAGRFSGWTRFSGSDGFYAIALQPGVYTFTVDPPGDGLPQRIVPMVTVTQDLILNFGYDCTLYLPIIFKPPALDIIDDFDDGEDPNALGGYSSFVWPTPCPQTIRGDYDPMAHSGPYGYRLSYNVTPICFGVWQTDLRDWDYSGFSTLTFWIKGASGGERPRVYLQDNDNCQIMTCRYPVEVGSLTSSWKQVKIPLNVFETHGVNLEKLRFFQVVFEHDNMAGAIYIDDIRFE